MFYYLKKTPSITIFLQKFLMVFWPHSVPPNTKGMKSKIAQEGFLCYLRIHSFLLVVHLQPVYPNSLLLLLLSTLFPSYFVLCSNAAHIPLSYSVFFLYLVLFLLLFTLFSQLFCTLFPICFLHLVLILLFPSLSPSYFVTLFFFLQSIFSCSLHGLHSFQFFLQLVLFTIALCIFPS